MPRLARLILLLALFVTATPGDWEAKVRKNMRPIKNSYIVTLMPSVAKTDVGNQAKSLAALHRGKVTAILDGGIRGFGFQGSESAAIALSNHPLVVAVEEDAYVELTSTPSCATVGGKTTCSYVDDSFWHLDRIDQLPAINSTNRSYSRRSSGAGVRAYVLDSGVRGSHDEFGSRVTVGHNMMMDDDLLDNPNVSNSGNPREAVHALDSYPANDPCGGAVLPTDYATSHGTAVASVLGGNTVGVAPGVTIVPVKVGGCATNNIALLAVARGLSRIYNNELPYHQQRATGNYAGGRAVVNISLRMTFLPADDNPHQVICESYYGATNPSDYTNCYSAIEHMVNSVLSIGVPVVVAAGNDKYLASNDLISRMGYSGPSSTAKPITVGGTMYVTDSSGNYSDSAWVCVPDPPGSSSCARNEGTNFGPKVSIYAPAWNMKVAHAYDDESFRTQGTAGTSFAAPMVAGAVARLFELDPTLSVTDVWNKLWTNADANTMTPDFDESIFVNKKLLYMSPEE